MSTQQMHQELNDLFAKFRETLADQGAVNLLQNPQLADAFTQWVDEQVEAAERDDLSEPPPADSGLAELVGLGPGAAPDLGHTRAPQRVEAYDETVTSERILAVGDLYYIYQHEKIGVFRVVHKLKSLFEAGTLRLSSGVGAFGLYRFDRRQVLRYTHRDRLAAYRRVLGYGPGPVSPGASPNSGFHGLFKHFIDEVTQFWRDKRISDVIRERANDPSFGSIATVRRAGLDLRNNLKWASYGHVNVLRVEVMQLLDEAFRILNADDVKQQFGAEHAWDVVEEVLTRYFNEHLATSPRQRMAVTGREVLNWVAQPFILQTARPQFEALLTKIAGDAEEWLTSAEVLGLARRRSSSPGLPLDRRSRPPRSKPQRPARTPSNGEFELNFETESEAEI